jgi:large subunit ribosomal protein L17
MHRHGYQGRKLQLAAGPRRALIRGQVTSLVLHEAITTTEAKAKEVAPYFEKLVTHAKKGTLAGGRALRSELLTENAVQKMLQELVPAFEGRAGGYTSIVKLPNRRGDNAPMARLTLVLNKTDVKPAKVSEAKVKAPAKTKTEKKPAAKTAAKTETKETAGATS